MRRKSTEGRFAERVVHGVDDAGTDESIVIWIERKQGALWAVGRAVDLAQRHEPQSAWLRRPGLIVGVEEAGSLELRMSR